MSGPLRKSTLVVFLYYFRNFVLLTNALCLPETSWDSTSRSTRQAGTLPRAAPAGRECHRKTDTIVTKLLRVKCGTLLLYAVLYTCFVGYVLLHYKVIHILLWQASVASSGESQVYYKRKANVLTQRTSISEYRRQHWVKIPDKCLHCIEAGSFP